MTETRLRLSGAALRGRDISRYIRERINIQRQRGIEPKCCYISQDTADAMHAMWHEVTGSYDGTLPDVIAGVPVKVGVGIGNDQFAFEHYKADLGGALRRHAVDNPLPDND